MLVEPEVVVALVHGAGHDSSVWAATQRAMDRPTIAVDLPGRGRRRDPLAEVTVAEAALAISRELATTTAAPIVLVGHSIAGTILPSVAARLDGQVQALVFVAGIVVEDREVPITRFLPKHADAGFASIARYRRDCEGRSFHDIDVRTASSIDSLNFSCQPMDWAGIGPDLRRFYIRCANDQIQSHQMQELFISASGASEVIEIHTGHTPAIEDPVALAALLDRIADAIISQAEPPPDGVVP